MMNLGSSARFPHSVSLFQAQARVLRKGSVFLETRARIAREGFIFSKIGHVLPKNPYFKIFRNAL